MYIKSSPLSVILFPFNTRFRLKTALLSRLIELFFPFVYLCRLILTLKIFISVYVTTFSRYLYPSTLTLASPNQRIFSIQHYNLARQPLLAATVTFRYLHIIIIISCCSSTTEQKISHCSPFLWCSRAPSCPGVLMSSASWFSLPGLNVLHPAPTKFLIAFLSLSALASTISVLPLC